jgi:hypothetical protein
MRWVLLIALVATTGCHAKEEARTLIAAIDAYRAASNDDKPAKADALDKVACTDDQVCAVKAVCVKSANATAHGLRLQREVEGIAKDGGGNQDELASKWKEASSDMAEGYGLLEECRNKTQALRDHYGLPMP